MEEEALVMAGARFFTGSSCHRTYGVKSPNIEIIINITIYVKSTQRDANTACWL